MNLAESCEEMRPIGAEESLPGSTPCLLDGAGSILGTYGPQAWISPSALFPENGQSQEGKSDRTSCGGDDLEEPGTFDRLSCLSRLPSQGEPSSRGRDTNEEMAHGVPWKQCGGCAEGAGPGGAGSRYRGVGGASGPEEEPRGCPHPSLSTGTTSILSCRPLKGEPGVGFEEPGENCAPPREEQPPPVLLSPSLQYAGAETLASKVQ